MYSDTADLSGEHTPARGLTHTQAQQRLLAEGANELPLAGKRDLAAIVLEAVREPMFLLLLVAGVIYLLLGDISDALMLMGFVCVVLGITIYQQHKTERVLEALRDLTSPRALVLRDGVEQRIAGREVVRGDILILSEGDRVPADAALIACHDFAVDESLLTGESVAVRKIGHDQVQSQFESETRRRQASDEDSVTNTARSERGSQRSITDEVGLEPGGDDTPFVYSGTLVVQGHGTARVLATGQHTELGKIGKAMQELAIEATPLQQEITRLVRKLAIIGVLLSLLLVAIYGIVRNDWLHGLLAGITLAMSLLPEEFPLILIVFLAMGAWKISRHQVLTRRVPTVEALGSITVLCVDKTGTLTFNHMAVQQMVVGDASFVVGIPPLPLPNNFHELLGFAILSNEVSPFDPMEKAIHAFGTDHLADTEYLHHDWVLEKEYALSPQLLAHSHVWRARDRDEYVVASKGAPEAVADLCHLDAAQLAALNEQINTLAAQGMRVLGVAKASYKGPKWPDTQHGFDFEFIGLIGLADPVRPTVTAALKECVAAGIRVIMITGDYPITAAAIARQIGLEAGSGGVVTGRDISLWDDAALRERMPHSNIFARMVPEQKLRLVNALKANGEVVAMTGDGVNDAPALKAAHIGIAMGGRGTDVAREAAALVLLNDDFATIVHAVRIGRSIFDNLRKAMAYILAVHIPIAGLSLIPLLLGWPPAFGPVHIVFLEMIINPACSIAFEAEAAEHNVMQRPPRNPQEPLFGTRIFLISIVQGTLLLLTTLAVLGYALHHGATESEARTLTFSTLVIGNLGLILVNRSWQRSLLSMLGSRNPALWWVIAGAFAFLILTLLLPFLREVFHFAPISPYQFILSMLAGLCSVLWFELYKLVWQR